MTARSENSHRVPVRQSPKTKTCIGFVRCSVLRSMLDCTSTLSLSCMLPDWVVYDALAVDALFVQRTNVFESVDLGEIC